MNLDAMRQARDDVADLTAELKQILCEPLADGTPEALDQAHNIARSYVQLIGAAVERFEEAARGA